MAQAVVLGVLFDGYFIVIDFLTL